MEFTLTKKNAPTGTVRVSLETSRRAAQQENPFSPGLGAELDCVSSWVCSPNGGSLRMMEADEQDSMNALATTPNIVRTLNLDNVKDGDTPGPTILTSKPPISSPKPDIIKEVQEPAAMTQKEELQTILCHAWTCVNTFGLEEFLKANGANVFQRKIAINAKWPAWEYSMKEDGTLAFVNHSAFGDLHETLRLDGT